MFVVFIPLLILVIVNVWIDSRGILNETHINSISRDLNEMDIAIYENIPERMIAKKRIELNKDKHFNKVVIGSSRILFFGRPIGEKVFNLAVSGGRLEDCISLYELLVKNNISFDTIVVSADPWLLNINSEDDRFEVFENNYFLSTYQDLFSWKYFLDNVQLKEYKRWNGDEEDFVRFSDGTIKYDKKYMNSNVNVMDYVNKDIIYQLGDFEIIDEGYKLKALNFFKELSKNHIVELILLPYHPKVYPKIVERVNILPQVENMFYGLKGGNIRVFGSYDPSNYNLVDSNFYDAMHITENGLKLVYNSHIKEKVKF